MNRIKAAVDARTDDQFVVMARTDAVASEGVQAGIDRAAAYVEAGADMIFAEALYSLEDYRAFTRAVPVPVLANITEFGKTPLFTVEELRGVGVRVVLYPLSAFRAMSAAAVRVYETIRKTGTQKDVDRPDANARAAVRRSELSLLRRQVGSTIYQKSESLNL